MKAIIAGAAALVLFQVAAASAEDSCPDPWANVQGTFKCEGSCNYTASVCNLPDYAEGIKRWRFSIGKGASYTGILTVSGTKTIVFAETQQWQLTKASTSDCGATIQFEGTPTGVQWRKVNDSAPTCGAAPRKKY